MKSLVTKTLNFTNKIPLIGRISQHLSNQQLKTEITQKLQKHSPVFVFQMGKVASSSVSYSLEKYYEGAVFHSHTFHANHHKIDIQLLYEHYQNVNQKIKIISLVREPISRNISAFFQNFKRDTGIDFKDHQYTVQEIQTVFLEKYNHDVSLIWFDEYFEKNFGIDVYSEPFPDSGHIVFKKNDVSLLLMRHDLVDATKAKLIKEFIPLTDFELQNENVSAAKIYAETYKAFKKLKLPQSYLDKMAQSKYMNHFYKKEISSIIGKWK